MVQVSIAYYMRGNVPLFNANVINIISVFRMLALLAGLGCSFRIKLQTWLIFREILASVTVLG